MKLHLLITTITMLGGMMLPGCQTRPPVVEEPEAVAIDAATARRLAGLGINDCDRVAAFTINIGKDYPDFEEQLVIDGALNPNRAPLEGVTLDNAQIDRFLDAVALQEYPGPHAYCFLPHHGIGFFRRDGSLLGHYTICLQCLTYAASTGEFVVEPDYEALRDLVKELKLPPR